MQALRLKVTYSNLDDDEVSDLDAEEWVREVGLEIVEANEVIGTASFLKLDADAALADGVSLFEMCDSYTQESYDCGEAVFGPDWCGFNRNVRRLFDDLPFSGNVLILDRLEILTAFRGRRIGLLALLRIMRRWGKGCALVVMKPFPLQYETRRGC